MFPPALSVHKGTVFYAIYMVGGLLITATVDLAVRKAHNLLGLSHTLINLVGNRCQKHAVKSAVKQKLKHLHFTESLNSLLDVTRLREIYYFKVLQGDLGSPDNPTNLESKPAISEKRCRIYYIFLCCSKRQRILKLHIRADDIRLKTFRPSNKLQWLIEFGRKAHARGDIVFILLDGQTGQIGLGFERNDAANERPADKFRSVGICSVRGSALDAPASHCSLCSDVVRLESTTTHQLSQPLSQRC
ncbi:unnamed protein product [Oreochromis niloticus]|nr:unnamed protein product [Mustela putorius furo]